MPNLYTIPAGLPAAAIAAEHILAQVSVSELSRAILLVPNRRSASVMRAAFQQALGGKAALLPRILPLADGEEMLIQLLGDAAFTKLEQIPPAMPEAQQRYLLAEQILAFEQRRMTGGVTLSYALTLADALMALQEQVARAGVRITQEQLRNLVHADFATHWKQAWLFLGIITDHWPELEKTLGMTTAAAREVALLQALAEAWESAPPAFPVFAIGSTASQPATAQLLKAIADAPSGAVILPGLDTTMGAEEWASISHGHPLFHVKALLDRWPVGPHDVTALQPHARSVWLDALAPTATIPEWRKGAAPAVDGVRIIPCAHPEEEARVIALLLREALEPPEKRVALITPDEGLMARVAAHMKRYDILVDRLNAGTLATTATGKLWMALTGALSEPGLMARWRELLHQPLLGVDSALLNGLERGWYGFNRRRAGQLPPHDAALKDHPHYAALAGFVKAVAQLGELRFSPSAWVEQLSALLGPWVKESGEGYEAVSEQLSMIAYADDFGPIEADDFAALLDERLATKRRDAGIHTHPRLYMLTPIEARLQQFDRVILANMQESIWPGIPGASPWLNRAAEAALGLPPAEDAISRMAHDMLMLGSGTEVFLTYPERDGGAPTARSRFIERLVTLYASHGIGEERLIAPDYLHWSHALDASEDYAPEPEIRPMPVAAQRPTRLPVTDIDTLFTDPFTIYAKHVLGLRALHDIDAVPEASDFGNLTHKAIEALTQHWNLEQRLATAAELDHIANHALRDYSERPSVDLFWRARLLGGLRYVNQLESERRAELRAVQAETTIEGALAGADVLLYGRIDRVEQRADGARAIDYKTGTIPSEKHILEGRALQLLAYAMLLEKGGRAMQAIEYWALPKLGDEGEVLSIGTPAERLAEYEAQLAAALRQMRDEQTPFLARPGGGEEHYANDYDGISRYDEWAG